MFTESHLGDGLHRRIELCQEPGDLFRHAEVVLSDPLMRLASSLVLLLKLLMGLLQRVVVDLPADLELCPFLQPDIRFEVAGSPLLFSNRLFVMLRARLMGPNGFGVGFQSGVGVC